jgi:23S rRNA maturation-related 3'-5' exoribonuclease YhaM
MKELTLIQDNTIKKFVDRFLNEKVPDYFFKVPASSTGKYHPAYTLGEGGLLRHTRGAVRIAYELFSIITFTQIEKDIILASLILHDSFKKGIIEEKYTKHEHPEIAANEIDKFQGLEEGIKNQISNAIRSHMGKWNTNKYSNVTLKTPNNRIQKFVHLCDYLASRKCIEVDLEC